MMSFYGGAPEIQYSFNGGKTWRAEEPCIGPGVKMRVITAAGKVLYSATAQAANPQPCSQCNGTGQETKLHYVEDTDGQK